MITDISHISDSFGYWFSGFVDGEGCFLIAPLPSRRRKERIHYYPRFMLVLRSDDKEIISSVKNILRIGSICFFRKEEGKKNSNSKPQVAYSISDRGECYFLVKFFEKYPLKTKKKNDFEIWKQLVIEKLKPYKEQDIAFQEYCFKKIKEVRLYQKPNISLEKPVKIDRQLKLKTGVDLKII